MSRVGQNHIYTVYIRYFWQGNHQIYGHIRCIYTILANPMHELWAFSYCLHTYATSVQCHIIRAGQNHIYTVQGCSVRGSAKSLGSQTFTHFNEFEKCRSELVKLYSMSLSKLQGTADPPSSVPLFPCSKSNMFNDLYMNYEI